jgi:hypothetical protein
MHAKQPIHVGISIVLQIITRRRSVTGTAGLLCGRGHNVDVVTTANGKRLYCCCLAWGARFAGCIIVLIGFGSTVTVSDANQLGLSRVTCTPNVAG